MRKSVIGDGRFHRHHPGLRKGFEPRIQLAAARTDFAFPVHTTSRVLHTIADRLLVNVQSDVTYRL